LAVAAIWARRDGGAGMVRIVLGILFSVLHVGMGGALLLYGGIAQESEQIAEGEPDSEQWVYESPDGVFRLALPSRDWREVGGTNWGAVAAFRHRPPLALQAAVLRADRIQDKARFDAAVQAARKRVPNNPSHQNEAQFRDGTTAAGNPFSFGTLMDSGPSGEPVFVGYSAVWCPKRQVIVEVVVEGKHKMASETGRAVEKEAFEKAAEFICLSVDLRAEGIP
jgi:hypothetical protein